MIMLKKITCSSLLPNHGGQTFVAQDAPFLELLPKRKVTSSSVQMSGIKMRKTTSFKHKWQIAWIGYVVVTTLETVEISKGDEYLAHHENDGS